MPAGREAERDRFQLRAAIAIEQEDFETALEFSRLSLPSVIPIAEFSRQTILIRALIGVGRLNEAREELSRLPTLENPIARSDREIASARLAMAEERWSEALDAWKSCLRIAPFPQSQPTLWTQIGDCLRQLGHSDAARLAWTNATRTNVESHWVQKAVERLAGV